VGPLVVVGLGMGLTFAPAMIAATAGIDHRDAGVASAMVNTSQQIGGAVGTAALSTIFTTAVTRYATNHHPEAGLRAAAALHGYTVAFLVSCGLFLAGAVLTALLLRSGRLPAESHGADGVPAPTPVRTAELALLADETTMLLTRVHHAVARYTDQPAGTPWAARPGDPDVVRATRAPELLSQGISHTGVALILDLEYRIARLVAENRYLAETAYLGSVAAYNGRPNPAAELAYGDLRLNGGPVKPAETTGAH
jgi:MFS family permease